MDAVETELGVQCCTLFFVKILVLDMMSVLSIFDYILYVL